MGFRVQTADSSSKGTADSPEPATTDIMTQAARTHQSLILVPRSHKAFTPELLKGVDPFQA